jgi:hypothetical protein
MVDSSSVLNYVALTLRGTHLQPDRVTAQLGASPSKAFARGDIGVHPKPTDFGYWRLRVNRVSETLDDLLRGLVDSIVVSELRELAREFDADIVVVTDLTASSEGELSINAILLQEVAAAGVALRFYWLHDGAFVDSQAVDDL